MGLFGSSKYDGDVEKATNENNTQEDWAVIMDICDKAGKNTDEAKNYMKAILKRLGNVDPHIAIQAVTLLDACVKNSGKTFHLEVASREFETEYVKLLTKGNHRVVQKLKESLKRWAEEDCFKKDPQLSLITSLYTKLKNDGVDFNTDTPTKKTVTLSKDPNVVQSQDEEDQIAKAIELSLKDASNSPRNYGAVSSSLYPSTNLTSTTTTSSSVPQKEPRKVRALYDFEAAEDNELTFTTGEVILVTDDVDPNWWKGSNHRGEGLFPANFVTSDLNATPEPEKKPKKQDNNEADPVKESASNNKDLLRDLEDVRIDEAKIDRLLHLVHEADPTNAETDTQEMQKLEREVNLMGPLIDTELERIDRKHAQLTQLSSDLVEAINLYHTLMPEPQIHSTLAKAPYSYAAQSMQQPMQSMYNGNMPQPPSMMPPSMMAYSIGQGQERQFMMHPAAGQMAHFPPGMQPPPGHVMHQPPHTSMGPISLPPLSMAPHQHQQQMHRVPPQQSMNHPQGQFHIPHGLQPNFPPGLVGPPNFPPHHLNGPHMTQHPVQNVPPPSAGQNANFAQQTSNTHIM